MDYRRPDARQIRSPRDAELAARDWMHFLGYADARVTTGGPDGGVDVKSSRAIAQVKATSTVVGSPVVQQLVGVAEVEGKAGMLFSLAGYSQRAIHWAKRSGIALFRLDLSGNLAPINERAKHLYELAQGHIVGWAATRAELETLVTEGKAAQIYGYFDLPAGYPGYWSIRVDLEGTAYRSSDFAGTGERVEQSVAAAVDFISRELDRISIGFWDCRVLLKVAGKERAFRPRLNYPAMHR